jgi:hypothetical protein
MAKLLKTALLLSIVTIVYNLIEGLVSIYFGISDDTLALFGFGADSFVEVISGIGIFHLVMRMRSSDISRRDQFERTALKVTGTAFYLLTAGLIIGSAINIINDVQPGTTMAGIVISSISIATMYFLMSFKLKVGRAMNSDAIIADAMCTKTCLYLSIILLASSGLYELFGIAYFDILGSLGIAYFAFKEGKEAIDLSKSGELKCMCESHDEEQSKKK